MFPSFYLFAPCLLLNCHNHHKKSSFRSCQKNAAESRPEGCRVKYPVFFWENHKTKTKTKRWEGEGGRKQTEKQHHLLPTCFLPPATCSILMGACLNLSHIFRETSNIWQIKGKVELTVLIGNPVVLVSCCSPDSRYLRTQQLNSCSFVAEVAARNFRLPTPSITCVEEDLLIS